MSTKIEDLSESEYEYESSEELELEVDEGEDTNNRIFKMLYEKVKEPIIVVFIMLVLTHPLLIQGIFRIPNVEVVDGTLGVNVILSILAGIIFFILREFV